MPHLLSIRARAAYKQTLRELESKSDEEIWEELKQDNNEVSDKAIKERLGGVPHPPPLMVSAPSSEYEQQEKLRFQELVQKHLNFFLVASPTIREFDPTSPEDKAFRDVCSHIIALYSLSNASHWQQVTERVVNACAFAHSLNEPSLLREIQARLKAMSEAQQGPQQEYARFLELLAVIGIVGTYRCRQSGGTEEEGRADERFALNLLPVLFHIHSHFFLRQAWVTDLLADWHDKGEEFYVQHAFFGTTRTQRKRYREERQQELKQLETRRNTSSELKKSRKVVNTPKKQQSYGQLLPELRRNEKLLTMASYLIETKDLSPEGVFRNLGSREEKGYSWAIVGKNNEIGAATAKQIWNKRKEPTSACLNSSSGKKHPKMLKILQDLRSV